MRILYICPYLPYPILSGGHTRVYNLLRELSTGHQVHLVAYRRGPVTAEQLRELRKITAALTIVQRPALWHPGNIVRYATSEDPLMHVFNGRSPALTGAIERAIIEWKPDLAHVEHFHTADCLLRAPAARRLPLVIGEQGVEYVILERLAAVTRNPFKKMLTALEHRRIKRFELDTCRQFARCIEVSDDDRAMVLRDGLQVPVDVVPNGVDTDYFGFQPLPDKPAALLFLGTFKFFGNRDAMRWLLERVWPQVRRSHPELTFYVVGNHPPRWLRRASDRQLVVTGWVPDVRDFMRQSTVVVSPIRVGSGTKLKILESMSAGRPVVTTTLGLEGIAAADGNEVVVRDDPDRFAAAITALLDDPPRAAAIGRAARDLIERSYSWKSAARSLVRCYGSAIAQGGEGGAR